MKNRDMVSALFWMGLGTTFAIGGLRQGLVRQGIPGPGSLPLIVGLILVGLSLILLIEALGKRQIPKEKFFPQPGSFPKIVLALIGIWGYGLFLKNAGFTLTTFIFLIFVLRFIGYEKWSTTILFSLCTAIFSYLLFTALQVELPKGIWRI